MEENVQQRQITHESSSGSHEDSSAGTAVRAVARLLANPRRTRRD